MSISEPWARAAAPEINRSAPAFGRKAVLYATCFTNYNTPDVGLVARAVLVGMDRAVRDMLQLMQDA